MSRNHLHQICRVCPGPCRADPCQNSCRIIHFQYRPGSCAQEQGGREPCRLTGADACADPVSMDRSSALFCQNCQQPAFPASKITDIHPSAAAAPFDLSTIARLQRAFAFNQKPQTGRHETAPCREKRRSNSTHPSDSHSPNRAEWRMINRLRQARTGVMRHCAIMRCAVRRAGHCCAAARRGSGMTNCTFGLFAGPCHAACAAPIGRHG